MTVALSARAAPRRAPRRCRSCLATASAGRAVVAGQHDDPQPLRVQRGDRLRRRGLDRIGDAEQRRQLARRRRGTSTVWPSRRSSSAFDRPAVDVRRRPRPSSRALPSARGTPSTRATTPLPGTDRKSDGAADRRRRARARRRESPPPADARSPARARPRARSDVGLRASAEAAPPTPASACPRSACRSCRRRACRPARAARAPRRS